jgi:L-lactate dehydrogenase complex protein LldF
MNEGNGRFCVRRPRVHVAMMGIEKIVPTLRDAAVLLKLLGRSGTAQKLTVETHLLTGPQREGDVDGPERMHVVIVDAGRTAILGSKYRDVLRCIRCGACLNTCPVYRSIGGHAYGGVYPGPIGKLLTPLFDGPSDGDALPHASSLCGACLEACPVKIDIPQFLVELRRDQVAESKAKGKARLIRLAMRAMRSPATYVLGQKMIRRLMRWRANEQWVRRAPGPLRGWTEAERDLPAIPRRSFRDLWKQGRI